MLEEELTKPEKLYLWRRRKDPMWKQSDVAKHFDVSVRTVMRWEAGQSGTIPDLQLHGMNPHEVFVIIRRRAGVGVKQLAERIGISRQFLYLVESGKRPLTKRILLYWKSCGVQTGV